MKVQLTRLHRRHLRGGASKKYLGLGLLMLVTSMAAPRAQAQTGVYGELTAAKFTNLTDTHWPIGATAGVLMDFKSILHNRIVFGGDFQGRFLNSSTYNYNGISAGARAYVSLGHGFRPYAEFAVGFARLKHISDQPAATTDAQFQVNGGVMKKISSHLDLTADFSYSQFGAFGGEYNPKAVSAGLVYYFNKR